LADHEIHDGGADVGEIRGANEHACDGLALEGLQPDTNRRKHSLAVVRIHDDERVIEAHLTPDPLRLVAEDDDHRTGAGSEELANQPLEKGRISEA
jgi:hypothetical protein